MRLVYTCYIVNGARSLPAFLESWKKLCESNFFFWANPPPYFRDNLCAIFSCINGPRWRTFWCHRNRYVSKHNFSLKKSSTPYFSWLYTKTCSRTRVDWSWPYPLLRVPPTFINTYIEARAFFKSSIVFQDISLCSCSPCTGCFGGLSIDCKKTIIQTIGSQVKSVAKSRHSLYPCPCYIESNETVISYASEFLAVIYERIYADYCDTEDDHHDNYFYQRWSCFL